MLTQRVPKIRAPILGVACKVEASRQCTDESMGSQKGDQGDGPGPWAAVDPKVIGVSTDTKMLSPRIHRAEEG